MTKEYMYVRGDNIISPLGFTSEENYIAVKDGISGVKYYRAGTFGFPEPLMASLIDRERLNDEFVKISSQNNYTCLEQAAILSVASANNNAGIDLSSAKTIFILSTTKGNIELLDIQQPEIFRFHIYLWHTAELIAGFFRNPNTPIVVSNACISGAAAQITAMRELETGHYDNAVVTGVDFLSKFIVSGFRAFKALSVELCRPFDKDRCGLNLGEAAATIIFSKNRKSSFQLMNGAVRNDANHISAPSRTGDGCFRALKYILQDVNVNEIAFINAHGTATPYNDAMEVNTILHAGLKDVPVNSLKPFFGHTLGAAGVLESIVSMLALKENRVLKSENINNPDFENKINVAKDNYFSNKKYFIKLLSGFGGCNTALIFSRK